MTGILMLENMNRGNTLKQGDLSILKYRLYDADSDNLAISGKPATVRLMKKGFTFIAYEKEGLVVSPDNTVSFNINKVLPGGTYYLEVFVDDLYIFPSRHEEGKFNIDRSSLGVELNIIENAGIDAVVRKAVDLINEDPSLIIDEDKLISEIIANTSVGSIEEYYQEYRDAIREYADLKPKVLNAISKSDEALTKSQNALNVANGIDAKATEALSKSTDADALSKSVQSQFNQVVINGDSSVEAAQARVDAKGHTNATLKERLDKEHTEVTAQLAHKATKDESRLKSQKLELEDLSPSVLSAIEGGEGTEFNLLSIPQPNSVTPLTLSKDVSGLNNYSTISTYTNGKLTKIEEKDGLVSKKITILTYEADGKLKSVKESRQGGGTETHLSYVGGGVSTSKTSWVAKTHVLKGSDVFFLATTGTETDYASFYIPSDAVAGTPGVDYVARLYKTDGTEIREIPSTQRITAEGIGGFYWSTTRASLVFEKDKYASLKEAKAALTGLVLQYKIK